MSGSYDEEDFEDFTPPIAPSMADHYGSYGPVHTPDVIAGVFQRWARAEEKREAEAREEERQNKVREQERVAQAERDAREEARHRQTIRWAIAGVASAFVFGVVSTVLVIALAIKPPDQWWDDAKASWAQADLLRIQVPPSEVD